MSASLHEATRNGDLDAAHALLAAGVDVNARDSQGRTALHLAAGDFPGPDYPEIARLLVARGADLEAEGPGPAVDDKAGWRPLHLAAKWGNEEIARILIDAGADPNARGSIAGPPLLQAILRGRAKVARLLIEKGADIHVKYRIGDTALHMAAEKGLYDIALWYKPPGSRWLRVLRSVHIFKNFGGTAPWLPVAYLDDRRFAVGKTVEDKAPGNEKDKENHSTIRRSARPRPKVSGLYISSTLAGGAMNVPSVVARAK